MKMIGAAEAIEEIRKGRMLIVVDRANRENEGDLFLPADLVSAEAVNFMIKFGRGLVCVPMKQSIAQKLGLELMISNEKNTEYTKCKFTIPVDFKGMEGSGISAHDRALTIKMLASNSCLGSDFLKPGHVFPLIAEEGGLSTRDGHTEAAVTLAEKAGFNGVGVICEIIGEDGRMSRGEELMRFANQHNLKIVSIEELKKNL